MPVLEKENRELSLKQVITKCYEDKKSLLAFNIQNIYQLDSLKKASLECRSAVIAQLSAKYVPYFDNFWGLSRLVKKYQNHGFFFHLDHCLDEKLIKYCVDNGFASVMFDGSSLPIEKNIQVSNSLNHYTTKQNCLLEIELGAIKGIEDGIGFEGGSYYSPDELRILVNNTKFDLLALGIGNAHGVYDSLDDIKLEKLEQARQIAGNIPFVLHGGTGMTDSMIKTSIGYGVVKINVSTALKIKNLEIVESFVSKVKSYDELKFHIHSQENLVPFFKSYLTKFTL